MDSMFQRSNYSSIYTMLDIKDNIEAFNIFSQIINLEKLVPLTTNNILGSKYDFVFIDADHIYEGVCNDYENIGKYCNMGGFP